MSSLKKLKSLNDLPKEYHQTPISQLVAYHNFREEHKDYEKAQMLIGSCMDFRTRLTIPNKFAFVIRNGGANLHYSEFHIAYALSVAQLKHMAVIGHTDCGMVNLNARKDIFIAGLAENVGWDEGNAERFFNHYAPQFEIRDAVEFTLKQVNMLRKRFPEIQIIPLIHNVEDHLLYLIEEN